MRHVIAFAMLLGFFALVYVVATFIFYVLAAFLTFIAILVVVSVGALVYWGADEILRKWQRYRTP